MVSLCSILCSLKKWETRESWSHSCKHLGAFNSTYSILFSGVGGGGAGGASAPPNILIIWKFGQNPWKSEQNPQISRKNLWKFGQKWRPMLLYFKKLSPNVCRKTSEDHFLKGHTKKRSAKVAQNFLGQFGKIWAKILCTPKNLIAPTPMILFVCARFLQPRQGRRNVVLTFLCFNKRDEVLFISLPW